MSGQYDHPVDKPRNDAQVVFDCMYKAACYGKSWVDGIQEGLELIEATKRESGARPMSSAPRNGTTILVFFKRHGWVSVAWDSMEDDGPKSEYADWHVTDFKHGPYPVRGYNEGDELGWMPLPEELTYRIAEGQHP